MPYIGQVAKVSAEGLIVRDAKGEHVLKFDANSFVRGKQGY
jgi:hypothetical protein